MNATIEDMLKKALKEVALLPENFTWHLHSMDCANLIRMGVDSTGYFGWSVSIKQLLGHPVHVDDRYPRWTDIKYPSNGEQQYYVNATGLVKFSLYKSCEVKKVDLLSEFQAQLTQAMRNAMLPDDFAWYLHPGMIEELHAKNDLDYVHPSAKSDHPDATNLKLLGHPIRNDANAPKGVDNIFLSSVKNTNNDRDWYLMWARRWGVDRKTAKNRVLFYMYGNEAEKALIERYYAARTDKYEPPS